MSFCWAQQKDMTPCKAIMIMVCSLSSIIMASTVSPWQPKGGPEALPQQTTCYFLSPVFRVRHVTCQTLANWQNNAHSWIDGVTGELRVSPIEKEVLNSTLICAVRVLYSCVECFLFQSVFTAAACLSRWKCAVNSQPRTQQLGVQPNWVATKWCPCAQALLETVKAPDMAALEVRDRMYHNMAGLK